MFVARRGDSPERVLVRLPNWVGDILMALPAVQALRAHLPDAYLVGMARAEHLELARCIAAFDQVMAAPPAAGPERRAAWWNVVKRLYATKLTTAVLLAPSFESALTVLAAGIPRRIGHATDRRGWLLSRRVPVRLDRHRSEGFLDVVGVLGAKPVAGPIPISFQAPENRYVEQLFEREGFGREARPVLVNPASAKRARAWSGVRFEELADHIAARYEDLPILVHQHAPFVPTRGWPEHPSIRLLRGATLVQLGAILQRCRLYIGNDSGPMHVAAALGVPTVGIYGPSSPDHTSPRGDSGAPHVAVSAFFSCSPCRERFFEECPSPPTAEGRPPCLDRVTVSTVLEQVDRLLTRGDRDAASRLKGASTGS